MSRKRFLPSNGLASLRLVAGAQLHVSAGWFDSFISVITYFSASSPRVSRIRRGTPSAARLEIGVWSARRLHAGQQQAWSCEQRAKQHEAQYALTKVDAGRSLRQAGGRTAIRDAGATPRRGATTTHGKLLVDDDGPHATRGEAVPPRCSASHLACVSAQEAAAAAAESDAPSVIQTNEATAGSR